ncbi:MAG: Fe-S oxidoreductase [Gammaproteobacteria bacterium]|nr:Fe-S oxidoreductase [Gammaproteobacteria bacterium]
MSESRGEGSLEAPIRHPINWKDPNFYDADALFEELERVFDICHGCRRCFNLCNSFPSLFDLVDESSTMEVDGVDKADYWTVVDHCYLCDMCYMSKCPYVPPHEWNVDFPHLMLRAKAVKAKQDGTKFRDKLLSSTDAMGAVCAKPGIAGAGNAVNKWKPARSLLQTLLGIHKDAWLPPYSSGGAPSTDKANVEPVATEETTGRVAIFSTCYGRNNEPHIVDDLEAILLHNGLEVMRVEEEVCCGMPKLELGDLESVEKKKTKNIEQLERLVAQGWDVVAPVPSCVLMFKQELPLLFDGDASVSTVQAKMFDPFEYLELRHRAGLLNAEFKTPLGKIDYHVACHLRVQNIGLKTRDVLSLIPETEVDAMERCSGHDGTYAVKVEFHPIAAKLAKPIARRFSKSGADYYTSDCPMAGHHIGHVMDTSSDGESSHAEAPTHPLTLMRIAYGL